MYEYLVTSSALPWQAACTAAAHIASNISDLVFVLITIKKYILVKDLQDL